MPQFLEIVRHILLHYRGTLGAPDEPGL